MKPIQTLPSERFLQAIMVISDETIAVWKKETIKRCMDKEKGIAYEQFLNWKRKENEVAVFVTYAYASFDIPKRFDCIFPYTNPSSFIRADFVLTQAIFEASYPIEFIDSGHKYLCILTFENEVPDIFKMLHYEKETRTRWQWNPEKVVGLCQYTDIENIIEAQNK